MSIVFPSGEQLRIASKPIGVGGEGKVYRIANDCKKNMVAKIYNKYPDEERQKKLNAMVSIRNPGLLQASAWPSELLMDTRTGNVCGFTMQEITESEPLHHYYSPSWRKQNQPSSSWDSLLQLSMNLAAVFSTVHSEGVVVGDVNPNSVRVRKNGRVVLIDSDSFQISHHGELFRCRVGVPAFTAPELLSTSKSFDSIKRDCNHDLFGLSLLIFHVLFMGRHPFAGVFLGSGDTPIESHIKEYRYAYALDHPLRGQKPPPLSISPRSVAGSAIISFFENDFTQMGSIRGRTKANQWFAALRAQRGQLLKCSANYSHVYDSSLCKCVWCELENKGVIFFQPRPASSPAGTGVSAAAGIRVDDLLPTRAEESEWKQLSSQFTQEYPVPVITPINCAPRHTLTSIERNAILKRSIVRISACMFALVLFVLAQSAALPLVALVLLFGLSYNPQCVASLIASYRKELAVVDAEVSRVKADLKAILASGKRNQMESSIESAWQSLQSLKGQFDKEIESKLLTAREQHKDAFLRSYLIADARITGIGAGRSSTLASYGIETAADISDTGLYGISGFGPVLVSSLLSWKKSILRQYNAPSDAMLIKPWEQMVLLKYLPIRRKAGAALQSAIEDFKNYDRELKEKLSSCEQRIRSGVLLASSIKQDITQLQQPASVVLKDRFPFLVL